MKSYWEMKRYLQEETEEQTIEFDLDGKSIEDIKAFLDSHGIPYKVEDGYFYVDGEEEESEEDDMQEATAKRKIVIRMGRKRIIFKCPPGKKKVGKMTCVVRKSSDLMKMKLRAKRSARKSKSKRTSANRKRTRSNIRRSTMGLNRRKR
jgi:hypothetical protein